MSSRRTTKKIGRLIRNARMSTGLTQKDLAAKLGVRSGSYVGMLESGLCKGVGIGRLREIAGHLDVHGVETYRWMAAAGHLPTSLLTALMKSPERWDEVSNLLGHTPRIAAPRSRRRIARSA
jgi:transcriptional regulator with XRE-family HTH domain